MDHASTHSDSQADTRAGSAKRLNIDGMHCAGCVSSVEKALCAVPGVDRASVNLADRTAQVYGKASTDDLVDAVKQAGFTASPEASGTMQRLNIEGMHCASCVSSVETALGAVPGVDRAVVNLADRTAQVYGVATVDALVHAVEQAGYQATAGATADASHPASAGGELQRIKLLWYKAVVAGVLGFGLMLSEMAGLLPEIHTTDGRFFWSLAGILTLFAMIYCGEHYYRGAWSSVQRMRANMDTLVALGTGSAWVYSMLVVWFPELVQSKSPNAYFEAALVIIAFINFGQGLEAQARGKTGDAIRALMDLQPPVARVLVDKGERMVAVAQLHVGDRIRVLSGDKIPVDGIIEEGQGVVNESMLTGESMPVSKKAGDTLIGGTINQNGSFIMRANQVGEQTVLAQIVARVREAQASKPEIGRLVDQVAAFFVPSVLIVAIVNALLWTLLGPAPSYTYAFETTMAILIIACPCALGLATPISIVVGVGKAAQGGILVKNAEALHLCRKLDVVAFDKTGTLTQGIPEVVDVLVVPNESKERLVHLAGSLERHSNHPLAQAITTYVEKQNAGTAAVGDFSETSGKGVSGTVNGQQVLVGSQHYAEAQGIDCDSLASEINTLYDRGQSVIVVAVAGKLIGAFGVLDPLKRRVFDSIQAIKQLGIRVVILSGDNSRVVEAIARQLEVEEFHAQLSPEDKGEFISHLRRRGAIVAMVGDGINDAPALASADVGFALGAGTDVAIESADITLLGESTHEVVKAIQISRATVRNIKQNLLGAFIYNSLAIPIAAGLLFPFGGPMLNPMFAGLAMALSSVTVVLNANRLRQFRFTNQ